MSYIVGSLAEKLRKALAGKSSLPSLSILPSVQPVYSAEFFNRFRDAANVSSVTLTGTGFVYFVNTSKMHWILKSLAFAKASGTFTFNEIAMTDIEGSAIDIEWFTQATQEECELVRNKDIVIPPNWGIGVYVNTHSVNGVLQMSIDYEGERV